MKISRVLAVIPVCFATFVTGNLFGQETGYGLQSPSTAASSDPAAQPYQHSWAHSTVQQYACEGCQNGCAACTPAKPKKPKPNPCKTSHKGVFYANDFSYLDDPDYQGCCLGDRLKNLGRCGNVDIGGQIRFRYHSERGMGQQAGQNRFENTQNDFLLSRLRLYTDIKLNDNFRLYAEGIHADVLTSNPAYVPRGIDRNYGDLLNLFLDVQMTDEMAVRVGRQELLFGAQRLISPLDWSNTRRTFEGVRMMSRYEDYSVDTFYTQVVSVIPGDIDKGDNELEFYGSYGTYTGMENATVDLYYLGLSDERGATNGFTLNTFGSRIFGKIGRCKDWLFEMEGMAQTGNFRDTNQPINAYAWTSGLGRKLENAPWKPTVWLFYDYARGDAAGGTFSQFNDLFPLGHKYLGFIDAVQRRNIESPNVQMVMSPAQRWKLLMWYHNFQAAETTSNVLSLGGTPAQDPTEDDFGNELDILATYNLSSSTDVSFGYSHLWAGDKILSGNDADFFYIQWQTNF